MLPLNVITDIHLRNTKNLVNYIPNAIQIQQYSTEYNTMEIKHYHNANCSAYQTNQRFYVIAIDH